MPEGPIHATVECLKYIYVVIIALSIGTAYTGIRDRAGIGIDDVREARSNSK
jgi:hypothetical protein